MKNVEPFLMKVHQIEREKNKSGKRVLFITGLVFISIQMQGAR